MTLALFLQSGAAGFAWKTDEASYPLPTTGILAYYPPHGDFGPDQTLGCPVSAANDFMSVGCTYVDPDLGTTIRRISDLWTSDDRLISGTDYYSRHTNVNADASKGLARYRDTGANQVQAIWDLNNGGELRDIRVTLGGVNNIVGWDPFDADILYYRSGTSLRYYSYSSDSTFLVHTFGGGLAADGASQPTLAYVEGTSGDANGRAKYHVVNEGTDGSPLWRVYDWQTNTEYTNTWSRARGGGWIAFSPDGEFLILADGSGFWSCPVLHGSTTLDTANEFEMASTGGDHAAPVSTDDGNNYVVRNDTVNIFRIDVSSGTVTNLLDINVNGAAGHYGTIPGRKNWIITSIIDVPTGDDIGQADPISNWTKFRHEIFAIDVKNSTVASPVIRRICRTRTRADTGQTVPPYETRSKPAPAPDGSKIFFASNAGVFKTGFTYSDMYAVDVPAF